MAGFTEHANEQSDSVNCGKALSERWLVNEGCVPCCLFDSYYELVICPSLRPARFSEFLQVP